VPPPAYRLIQANKILPQPLPPGKADSQLEFSSTFVQRKILIDFVVQCT